MEQTPFETHIFLCDRDISQVSEQDILRDSGIDMDVTLVITDPKLPEILDAFEAYLLKVGYVFPDNTHLGLVKENYGE